MKALSIKEPFASLIANNIKKIETRSFKTKYRGKLYIHASLSKISVKDKDRLNKLLKLLPEGYSFKYGKIICECNLVDCIFMDEEFINTIKKNKLEYLCGHYEVGRYAWVLEDIKVIDGIQIKGKLGIWNFDM